MAQFSECSVCLSGCDASNCITLSCSHSFHKNCLTKWFETGKNTCPMCRNVCKNNSYFTQIYTNRFIVVQRKLSKLEKVNFYSLSEYWQETMQDLEKEYMDICEYMDTGMYGFTGTDDSDDL
jgi:hypothetical protein